MAKAPTDAEKLAAAELLMAQAAAEAKAARLPSVQAVVALLAGEQGQAFLTAMKACLDANIDDLPRPIGQPGSEGSKQMLQRIVTSFEGALQGAQARVVSLQPAPPAEDAQAAPVAPAEA